MKALTAQRLGLVGNDADDTDLSSSVDAEPSVSGEHIVEAAVASQPRVFLSHATADKERFVIPLDAALRAKGLSVWLDERDLIPGQNLVDEIFTHGISKADVFVVVLSKNSIDRPWVHEELSVAVVQRIDGAVKAIIPVVLDGVSPPAALSATVQIRVREITDIEGVARRISGAVFGTVPAPVAAAPAYAGIPVHRLSGLEPDDERIFAFACESLIANPVAYPYVQLHNVLTRAEGLGMPRETFVESISVLSQRGMFSDLKHYHEDGEVPSLAKVPSYSFERYLVSYRPTEYRTEKLRILSAIVNDGATHSRWIAQTLGVNEYIVDHVFEQLENAQHVMAVHSMDGTHIRPNASLRRVLRDMEGEGD